MKLSLTLLLASLATTSATKAVSAKNAAKVLRAARKMEDANADANNGEVDYSYLAKYSLKMIGCKAGMQVMDAETGEYEYNAAIFRLCPTESGCADESVNGCKEGYGDFVVGLNTFVQGYFEDQRDNMNWDDQFQVDRYAECGQYEIEQAEGDDANANQYADMQFFIGPTCTSDELDVKLALFSEETCTTASSVSFEEISNGWTMPFSSGGMVSTYCSDCVELNENDGTYGLREMCTNLYMEAAYACEEKMEYFSYYGQNTQGCSTIDESMPSAVKKASKNSSGGKVFGWIVFALLVVGMGSYVMWWRKSKYRNFSQYNEETEAQIQQMMAKRQQRVRWWQWLRRC